MKEQYKGQFESWQPGYPAIIHSSGFELNERLSKAVGYVNDQTMKTHSITINAIKKAGGYE